MAVTTTPLGLRVPDGKQLAKTGDDDLAANARKTDDLIQQDRGRLDYLEAAVAAGGTGGEPGSGSTIAPDPNNAGLYFIL